MSYAGIKIGDIFFRAVISSNHEMSCTLAQHTLENGTTITDHVILNPRRFTIEIDIPNTEGDVWTIAAFEMIETTWRNREPFTVITHHGIYDNMVIETGSFVENDTETGRLVGHITVQQLMFTAVATDQNNVIDPNALPGTTPPGRAAMPQTDQGILLEDPNTMYDITLPDTLENAANGILEHDLDSLLQPLPGPESLEPVSALQFVQEDKPSRFPISYQNGNVTFSSPVSQDTFNRFRTYTSYGINGTNVLLDVLDVNGNPIRSGINMVPGGDNLLRGYTDDLKINVLDITPRLPIGERIGTDSVQVCVGAAETLWPKIKRYD